MYAPRPRDSRPAQLFTRYHRHARKQIPWLQTLVLAIVLPLLALVARVRIVGRERIPAGGYIVAANHPSLLDGLFVAAAIRRRIRFMGKSELFGRGWGSLFSWLGVFPVRRGNWDEDAFETAAEILRRGRVMGIFPEGKVAPGGASARPGVGYIAQIAGAVIVPVHLDGPRKLYKPWTFPQITVTIGEPFEVARDPQPTRERTQAIAERVLEAIYFAPAAHETATSPAAPAPAQAPVTAPAPPSVPLPAPSGVPQVVIEKGLIGRAPRKAKASPDRERLVRKGSRWRERSTGDEVLVIERRRLDNGETMIYFTIAIGGAEADKLSEPEFRASFEWIAGR